MHAQVSVFTPPPPLSSVLQPACFPLPSVPHPLACTSMISRRLEAGRVVRSALPVKWQTIVGSANIGKTVLAQHVAYYLYERGVFKYVVFVELEKITSIVDVVCKLVSAVRLCFGRGFPAASRDENMAIVKDVINGHEREKVLIVLDNLDPCLKSDAAELVSQLLGMCGNSSVIVTCRVALLPRAGVQEGIVELGHLSDSEIVQVFLSETNREPLDVQELNGGLLPKHPVIIACDGLPGIASLFARLRKAAKGSLNNAMWQVIGGLPREALVQLWRDDATLLSEVVQRLRTALLVGDSTCISCVTAMPGVMARNCVGTVRMCWHRSNVFTPAHYRVRLQLKTFAFIARSALKCLAMLSLSLGVLTRM